MEQLPPTPPESLERPLAGRKLYSPGALAAYTALGNLPLGFVLYGLNMKARGQRRLGLSMVCFGAACLVFLGVMSVREALPGRLFLVISIFAAINVYQLERRPFERALAQGASRARWWPPALAIVIVALVLLAIDWLISPVA